MSKRRPMTYSKGEKVPFDLPHEDYDGSHARRFPEMKKYL